MEKCIHILPDGPEIPEECKKIDEFYLNDEHVWIGLTKNKKYYINHDGWTNFGPFDSHIEALKGLTLHFFNDSKKMYEKITEVQDLINKI